MRIFNTKIENIGISEIQKKEIRIKINKKREEGRVSKSLWHELCYDNPEHFQWCLKNDPETRIKKYLFHKFGLEPHAAEPNDSI